MRKALILLPLLAIVLSTACATGPTYLNRTVDDYHNNMYQKDPLLTWALTDVILRIAQGSGTTVQDINKLLKSYTQSMKMIKKFNKGGMRSLKNMLPF